MRWLMSSDVCKHCTEAACLDVCPTGALFRTEFDTVVVQPDVCNGCGYCVVACPFGVLDRRRGRRPGLEVHALLRPPEGRQGAGLRPGVPDRVDPVRRADDLRERAGERLEILQEAGRADARLYGADPDDGVGGFARSSCCSTTRRSTGCRPTPWSRRRHLRAIWAAGLARRGARRDRAGVSPEDGDPRGETAGPAGSRGPTTGGR